MVGVSFGLVYLPDSQMLVRLANFRTAAGFVLEEVIVSMAIATVVIAGIVSGYIISAQRADWSAHNGSAQALATQRLEQVRAAKWDTLASPPVDEVVTNNFPVLTQPLEVPLAGTNKIMATVITQITRVEEDPELKLIQVECIWSYLGRGPFTNSIMTYRAPDQ